MNTNLIENVQLWEKFKWILFLSSIVMESLEMKKTLQKKHFFEEDRMNFRGTQVPISFETLKYFVIFFVLINNE